MKQTAAETTVFVYSGSKLIAEYSTEAPPPNRTTRYTVTDQLGSPRVVVDAMGQVVSRRDFLPFGEEILPDGVYRKPTQKYGDMGNVRQQFTGYEKDEETGLDFAEARMYENRQGRFTAVDPLLASGKSSDPQTFNRYVYVMNNPLALTDPTGLQAGTSASEEGVVQQIQTWICKSFWCKVKEGFNQLARSIIGKDNHYHEEDIAFEERKRSGPDKKVGDAVNNYIAGVETLNEAVVENDPTGVGRVVQATVQNSAGRATDGEVYAAMGSAALNSAATLVPVGKVKLISRIGDIPGLSKAAETAGKNVQKGLDALVSELGKGQPKSGYWYKEIIREYLVRPSSRWCTSLL